MESKEQEEYDWTEGIETNPILSSEMLLIKSFKGSKYVSQNIPGPGCCMDDFEENIIGCQCGCTTCDTNCQCLIPYGNPYIGGQIRPGYLDSQVKPIFECNSNCTCSQQCENRLVQHGIKVNLQIFKTKTKGLGLQCLDAISKGTFVCEYAGEILSLEEARQRTKSLNETDMNYILTVKEHCKTGVLKTFVDPMYFGNIGRYINHSCEPNLGMVPVRVDNMVPKLCLFALRDIEPLEELTYQYGTVNSTQKSDKVCHCSSASCTGFMPYDEELLDTTIK